MHAASCEASVSLAQAQLRTPRDFSQFSRQAFLAHLHLASDACRVAVRPGRFDQDTPGVGVAGASDSALGAALATGALARHQPEEGHQLLRMGEAAQVAELCNERYCTDEVDATQGEYLIFCVFEPYFAKEREYGDQERDFRRAAEG